MSKERQGQRVTQEYKEKQAIQVLKVIRVSKEQQERLVTQEYKEKQVLQARQANHPPTTIIKRMQMTIQAILEMAIFYGIMQRN